MEPTETQQNAGAGSVLSMIAALHMWMAQHPEVSALPVYWLIDERDGISMGVSSRPNAEEIVARLAALLEVEVHTHDTVLKDGRRSRMVAANGSLGGHQVFVSGSFMLDGGQ